MSTRLRVLDLRVPLAFALFVASQAASAQTKPAAPIAVPAEARRLEAAFATVAERVSTSVVQVDVGIREEVEGRASRGLGRSGDTPLARAVGSGVVLAPDGTIVTSNNLVEDALSIQVRLADGRVVTSKLVGRDPTTDIAVLKVETSGLTPARTLEADPKVGQWVVAVGAQLSGSPTLSSGIVAAKGRGAVAQGVEEFVLTDATIASNNTGGPLCDLEGRVIGIGSAALSRGAGVGVAVPIALAKRVAEQIVKTGRVERAWLGASLQDLTPELAGLLKLDPPLGVLIAGVADNGPAKKANLKAGDVVAAVAGKPAREPADITREVLSKPVGHNLPLEVVREGKRYASQVTLTQKPEPPLPPVPAQQQGVPQVGLGFNVRDLTAQESVQRGLPAKALPVVTVVAPGSAADRAGLKVGDVIVEADGAVEIATKELQAASQDGQLLLRLRRREAAFYAALKK